MAKKKTPQASTSTSAIKERIQQMYEEALQRHKDKEQAERLRDEAEIGGGSPPSKSTLTSSTDAANGAEVESTATLSEGVSAVNCLGKVGEGAWPFLLRTLQGTSSSIAPSTTPTVSSLLSYLPALPLSAMFKSLQFGLHVDVCNPAQPLSISASPPEVLLLSPLFSSKPTSSSPLQEGPNVSVVTTTVELQIDIVVFDGFDTAVMLQCEGDGDNNTQKAVELQLEVVLEGNGLEGMEAPQQTQASMFNGRNTSGRPTTTTTTAAAPTTPADAVNRSSSIEMLGGTFGSMQQVDEDGTDSTSSTSDIMELNRTQTAGPMSFNGAHIVINKVSRYEYIDRSSDGCRVLRIFMPITQAAEMDTSRGGGGAGIGGLTIHDPSSNPLSGNKSSVTNVLTPGSYGVRSLKAQLVSPSSSSTTIPTTPLISLEKVYECCLFTDEEIRQGLEEVAQNQQQEECDYECDPVSLDDFQLYCVEVSEDHTLFAQNALLADLSPGIMVVPQPEVGADIRVTFPQDCHPATGTLPTPTSSTTASDHNSTTATQSCLFDGVPRAVISLTFAQNPGALSNTLDAVLAGETRGDIALIHVGDRVASVTAGGGGVGGSQPLLGLNDDHPHPDPSQNACNLFHLPTSTTSTAGSTSPAGGAPHRTLLMFESGLGDKTLVAPSRAISRPSTNTTSTDTAAPPAAQHNLPTFHEVVNKIAETKNDVQYFPFAASSRLQRLEEAVNPRVVAVCSFDPTSTTLPTATVSVTTPQTTTRGAFSSSCTFLDSSLAPNASTAALMNTSTDTSGGGGRGGGGDPEVLVHSIFKVRMIPLAAPQSRNQTSHANVALTTARSMIRSNSMVRILPTSASSQSPGGTTFNAEAALGGSINRGRSLEASLVSGSSAQQGGLSVGDSNNVSLASPYNTNTSSPLLRKPSAYGGGGRRQSRVRLMDLGLTSPTFLGTEVCDNNNSQAEQPSMTSATTTTTAASTAVSTSMLIVIYVDVDVLKRLTHRELNLLKLHLKSIDVEVPVLPEFISAGYEQSTAEWMAQRAESGAGGNVGAMIASTNGSFALSPLLQDPTPYTSSASPRVVENRSFARWVGSTLNGGDTGLYQSFAVLPSARNHNNNSTSALVRQGGGINNHNNSQQLLSSAAGSPRGGLLLSVPSSRTFRAAQRSPMDSARLGESPAQSTMFTSHASVPVSGSTSSYPIFDGGQQQLNRASSKFPEIVEGGGTDWGQNKRFPTTQPLGKIPLSFALLVNDKASSSPATDNDATTTPCITFSEPPTFKDASFPGLVAPFSRAIDTSVSYVVMPARSSTDDQQPPISLSGALEGSTRPASTKQHHTKNSQTTGGGVHKQTIVAKIVVSNVLSNTPILVSGIDLVVLPRGAVASTTTASGKSHGSPKRRRNTKSGGSPPQDAGAKPRMPTLNMQGMMAGSSGMVGKVNSYPRGGRNAQDDYDGGQRRKGGISEVVDINGVRHLDSIPSAVFAHFDTTPSSFDIHNDAPFSSSLPPPPLRVVRRVGAFSNTNTHPPSSKNTFSSKGKGKAVPASSLGSFSRGSSLIPSASSGTTTTTAHSPNKQLTASSNTVLLLPGCSTTALIELQVDPGFVPCHQRECHYARALISYRLYDPSAAAEPMSMDDTNHSKNNNNMFLSPISQFKTSHLSVFSVLLRPLSEQETHQALLHNLGASSPLRPSPECGMTPPPSSTSPLGANQLTGSPLRDRYLATPPHCWGVAVGVPCHFDVQIRPDVNNQGLLQQELRKEASKHHSKCALCKKHLLKATKWAISRSGSVGPTGRKSSVTMLDSTANHVDVTTVANAHSSTVTSTSVVDPVTLELLVPLHFQVILRADPTQWAISGRTATSFTFPLRLLTPAYKRARRDSKKKKNQLQVSTSQFPPPPRLRFAALPVSAGVIDTPTASLRRVPVHEALHNLIAEYLTHVASLAAMAVPITSHQHHQQHSASSHRPTALSMGSTVDDSPQRPTSGTVLDHGNQDDDDDDRSVIFDDKTTDLQTRSEGGSSDGTCFEHADESETEEDDDDVDTNDATTREMFYSTSSFEESADDFDDENDGPLGRKGILSRQTSTTTDTKPVAASVVCTREKFFGIDAGFTKPN